MRANSIIMVLLAGVFGVLAVVLANMWLANQRSQMARAEEAPQATIVVASAALKFGDPVTTEKMRVIPWPAGAIPAGAFRTVEEVLAKEGGRQALQAIGANEPILASRITGPGQRATLSAVLADGMKAVSIRVNDVLGVAGFVFPGDRVDILLTRNVRNGDGTDQSFVDVLLQSIKVLAVDQVADESSENPTVVKAVTLEVSTKDAQKLTLAAGAGQLSLALRQVAANEGETTARITLSDLTGDTPNDVAARQAELDRLEAERRRNDEQLDGLRKAVEKVDSRLDELGRVKPAAAPAEEARELVREVVRYVQPEPPSFATIGVFRGTDRATYDVPRIK